MGISEICNLEPKEFLEKVKATPYSWEERGWDLYFLFKSIVRDMIFGSYFTLKSYWVGDEKTVDLNDYCILDLTNIDELCEKFEVYKSKLIYIFNTTEILAQTMGVTNVKVGLNFKGTYCSDFAVETPSCRLIGLSLDILNAADDEIAQTIAHELAHHQHGDVFKSDRRWDYTDYVKVGIDCIALITALVFVKGFHRQNLIKIAQVVTLRTVLQGVAGMIFRKIRQNQEQKADAKSFKVLNSSSGLVKYMRKALELNYLLKHCNIVGVSAEQAKNLKNSITPHGNDRKNTKHPPLTKRLEYALNFQGSVG